MKYYNVVKGNIPREETEKVKQLFDDETKKTDKKIEAFFCGSFRRGKQYSNDFDVLIFHPDITKMSDAKHSDYLERLVNTLTYDGYILDHLTDKNYKMKYMGFFRYSPKHSVRRIDIRLMPMTSMATALLHHTGPSELNMYMRTEAIKRGMTLNEYGLYRNVDGKKKQLLTKSENDVFKKIGMEPMSPIKREDFNSGKGKKFSIELKGYSGSKVSRH